MKKKLPFQLNQNLIKTIAIGIAGFCGISANAQTTTFNYTGSMQTYTVPVGVTLIHVDAQGAQGGSITIACAATGGLGARMQGDVTVTPGEVLQILVGGQGQTQGEDGGGGGGSFVVRTGNVPLVVAGGGGGATNNIQICTGLRNGVDASITTSGTASANGLVAGGTGGNGGGANVGSGCGGGGFYTDGAYAANMNGRGRAFVNGGAGGTGQNNNHGGYGGGGCGWYNGGNGGGGGGYSGGGTDGNYPSTYFGGGGGGGSYNIGTNQVNTAGYKTGNGLVVITVLNQALSTTVTQSAFISCNGQSTASLVASPTGGTSPYSYSWAPSGGTSATASGLSAGTYTVTVTDNVGGTTTQTFTVTQPSVLVASASANNTSCFGSADGSTVANVTGGTPGYTYVWNTGQTTVTNSMVPSGVYTYTVTDANGCSTTASATVTSPSAINANASSTSITCFGDNNGSASVAPTGGTPGYTYMWSNGGTSGTISLIAGGVYTYTITDANGCTLSNTLSVTEPAAISVNATTINASCNGTSDGSIDLTVTGGTGPFTFSWNNGQFTTEDLTNIPAGSYSGVLTDANGCQDSGTVVISEPAAVVATLSIASGTVCATDAAFTLSGETPSGGVFSGTGVTAGMFDPASAGVGTHVITYMYTDTAGCSGTATDSITVDICTGLSNNTAAAFNVYPNPNNGTFTINLNSVSDVTIFDAQGKLVYSAKMLPENQNIISLENNGMYMINVTDAQGQRSVQRVNVAK